MTVHCCLPPQVLLLSAGATQYAHEAQRPGMSLGGFMGLPQGGKAGGRGERKETSVQMEKGSSQVTAFPAV